MLYIDNRLRNLAMRALLETVNDGATIKRSVGTAIRLPHAPKALTIHSPILLLMDAAALCSPIL